MRISKKLNLIPLLLLLGIVCLSAKLSIAPTFARYANEALWQGVYEKVNVSSNFLEETPLIVSCATLYDGNIANIYEIQLKTDGGSVQGELTISDISETGVNVSLSEDNPVITEDISTVNLTISIDETASTAPVTFKVQLKTADQTLTGVFTLYVQKLSTSVSDFEATSLENISNDNISTGSDSLTYYEGGDLVLNLAESEENKEIYGLNAYTKYSYTSEDIDYNVVLGYAKAVSIPSDVTEVEFDFDWSSDINALKIVQNNSSTTYAIVKEEALEISSDTDYPVIGYNDSLNLTVNKDDFTYYLEKLTLDDDELANYIICDESINPPIISVENNTIRISIEGNLVPAGTYRLVIERSDELIYYVFYVSYSETLTQVSS